MLALCEVVRRSYMKGLKAVERRGETERLICVAGEAELELETSPVSE